MDDFEKDIDETLDEAKIVTMEEVEGDYKIELWLSTDGKNTVKVEANTPAGRKQGFRKAIQWYDFIKEKYGTKQAQARTEYSKPPVSEDDPSWCPIHKTSMKQYSKDGRIWYSHNVDGQWCNSKKK